MGVGISVEEERIKSALEIAMERISGLPELTPEDIAAQKEKQYAPIGEALAGKYLSGLLNDDELTSEAARYPADQNKIVRRALLSGLCRTLRPEGEIEAAGRAFMGMSRIAPEKIILIEKAAERFRTIFRAFDQEKQKKTADMELPALQTLGISGTAVQCNPAENAHWLEEVDKLRKTYEFELEALRALLLRELQIPG
jgi:hypothetical protein